MCSRHSRDTSLKTVLFPTMQKAEKRKKRIGAADLPKRKSMRIINSIRIIFECLDFKNTLARTALDTQINPHKQKTGG